MKLIYTCIAALILLCACQKDNNFVIKEEAFAVVTSGFNGSSSELELTIDTLSFEYLIAAGQSFNRTDKYTFPPAKDSVKLTIKEKETGKLVYEKQVKKGEYSLTIQLIYVGGKLIEKPTAPANNPEGFRLASYLFLPDISGYTGDVDIAYIKYYDVVIDGKLVREKEEELARITAKPYVFSEFLKAPVFQGGRHEIDGKVYFINPDIRVFKSGTSIRYYEDAGFTLREGAFFPFLNSVKPQIVGVAELGEAGSTFINDYQQINF
ncbi:hypothetical protein MRBLMN1_002650 [Chitinophaga ginsengisegetis]|uniref:hypothetical protein n=1 Tax=Chitinophaga ginsengisegetis TaxID=393003 RepID=UPI000DB99F09|nr:hypothetical protein [Chitinophaga ginsengisegetis]MDR6568328.1 hypothetical protein [Chitinophaga ginsengisegetis]MDR6648441.1 hypothetical protein [Chitinophaga ginsengisegetis]MDR6654409.1 hypothetical protein [Chitinophaga ginsengisegetis]